MYSKQRLSPSKSQSAFHFVSNGWSNIILIKLLSTYLGLIYLNNLSINFRQSSMLVRFSLECFLVSNQKPNPAPTGETVTQEEKKQLGQTLEAIIKRLDAMESRPTFYPHPGVQLHPQVQPLLCYLHCDNKINQVFFFQYKGTFK